MSTSRSTAVLTALIGWMVQPVAPGAYAAVGQTPWPGYQHDTQHTGRSEFAVNGLARPQWQFATGDFITHRPAIGADGTIYVGSNDHRIYAINPDGTQQWSYLTGFSISTVPAIAADGTIYVPSQDDFRR